MSRRPPPVENTDAKPLPCNAPYICLANPFQPSYLDMSSLPRSTMARSIARYHPNASAPAPLYLPEDAASTTHGLAVLSKPFIFFCFCPVVTSREGCLGTSASIVSGSKRMHAFQFLHAFWKQSTPCGIARHCSQYLGLGRSLGLDTSAAT